MSSADERDTTSPRTRRAERRAQRRAKHHRVGGGAVRGRRWWMIAIVVPVSVIMFVASVVIGGGWIWSYQAAAIAKDGQLDRAEHHFRQQLTVYGGWLERWRPRYNLGTTLAMKKQYPQAEDYLRDALTYVPKAYRNAEGFIDANSYECMVRMNLSLVLEAQGDANDDPDASQDLFTQAADLSEPCSSGQQISEQSDQGMGQPDQSKQERHNTKQAQQDHDRQQSKSGADTEGDQSPSDSDDSSDPSDGTDHHDSDSNNNQDTPSTGQSQPDQHSDKQQRDDKHRESDEEKQRQRDLQRKNSGDSDDGDTDPSGGGFSGKPW